MRVLLSAYSCSPESGSEPGAGYSLARAAAAHAETWVLTRANNASALVAALEGNPTHHPVHVIPVEVGERAVALKRRYGTVRAYYGLWQGVAAARARALDGRIDFDVVHHATFSAYWLPMGVVRVAKPLVVGPLAGGALAPRSLVRALSPRDLFGGAVRWGMRHTVGPVRRQQLNRRGAVVIAQEPQTARVLQCDNDELVMIHSHASDPWLPPLTEDRQVTRELVFVGRLVSWKGTKLAIAALAQADADVTLTFIGAGPDQRRLERLAARRGLQDRVAFAGLLPRLETLDRMRCAAALLFPSLHDSAGFAVSEALSMGTPVICLDHAGPGVLTRLWPQSPHVAVQPDDSMDRVVANLAAAINKFAQVPGGGRKAAQAATTPLAEVVGIAYRRALSVPAGS